ncbi:MAG: acyltransferase [Stenomitos rutilans HA7619-LM2]|jgi:hypothetical protein|nr:acyltransferase [Stenomitos rutilans HA7619-LM2]
MHLSNRSKALKSKTDSDLVHNEHREKIEGFDFLRAVFTLVILASHTRLVLLPKLWGMNFISDILYANFVGLAVPCFFQVSLFIFILKSEETGWCYFLKNRLPKLIFLYFFWVTSKILFDILLNLTTSSELKSLSIRGKIEFFVSGGSSPFYFFFSLLFVTTLAAVLVNLFRSVEDSSVRLKLNYGLLIASSGFMLFISMMNLVVGSNFGENQIRLANTILNVAQWDYNPLSFIPYIFTATITVHEFRREQIKRNFLQKLKLYGMLILFLAFTLIDWSLFKDIFHHARVSLVFGSWLLLYLAILSTHKPSKTIRFLSNYSLGIYAFHLFFTHALFSSSFYSSSGLAKTLPGLDIVVEFFVALVGSVALTLAFKRTSGLRRFV